MTTGTAPDLIARRRRWAEEQLGVGPQATAGEARAALLRRLRAEEFMPSAECHVAQRVLGGQAVSSFTTDAIDRETRLEDEPRLREEVENLAQHFWRLSPTERKRQWQILWQRCAGFTFLQVRLAHLQLGLEIVPTLPENDLACAEVTGHILDLFVLRPEARAIRRQELLRHGRSQFGSKARLTEWIGAAKRLRERQPNLVDLEPEFVDQVIHWVERRRKIAKANQVQAAANQRSTSRTSSSSGRGYGWMVWVAVVIIGGIVRAGIGSGSNKPTFEPQRFDFKKEQLSPYRMQPEQIGQDSNKTSDEKFRKMFEDIRKDSEKRMQEEQRKQNPFGQPQPNNDKGRPFGQRPPFGQPQPSKDKGSPLELNRPPVRKPFIPASPGPSKDKPLP